MDHQASPDVQRLRLRMSLRKARDDKGFTQRAVAEELGWSLSKLVRIENGQSSVSKTDLKALLGVYQIDAPELVAQLLQFGMEGRTNRWAAAFRDIVKPEFLQLLSCESIASISREYSPVLVPGLLQTKDYAMALARSTGVPKVAPKRIKELVEARTKRLEYVDDGEVQLHFILDEAVIRRWVGRKPGDPSIMRAQLRWIKELNRRPNITIQVIPFRHGPHAGLRGPFILLQLEGVDDWMLYQEAAKGSSITRDNSTQIDVYQTYFADLTAIACKPEELDPMVDGVLKEMRG